MSLTEQLTKKNQDFITIAKKQLLADGKTASEAQAILDGVMPDILEAQKRGETARHLLGAPTAWAATFSQPEPATEVAAEETNTNPYLMWLDMSLLFIGVISLLNLAMSLFSKDVVPTKLISLLTLGFLGGLAMYLNYHLLYRHLGKPKSQRPNMWKAGLAFVAVIMTWTALTMLTNLLPDSINITLALPALAIIGTLALAGRFFLKRRYKIQSAMSPRA